MIGWPDLALVPLTKMLRGPLQRSLILLPRVENPSRLASKTELLKATAAMMGKPRRPVAKARIQRAIELALDYRETLIAVRAAQRKVTGVLKATFPEFFGVFRSCRTKGATRARHPPSHPNTARPPEERPLDPCLTHFEQHIFQLGHKLASRDIADVGLNKGSIKAR